MKKLIALLFSVFIIVQIFAQTTPVGEFRATDRTVSFGFNIPAASKVYVLSDSTYWSAKVGILGNVTITNAIAAGSLMRINKPETDPIVRAIHGVVMSDGTIIRRVKSGVNIITINGDSLLKSGNIELVVKNDSSKLYERIANKVTLISSASTNIQYPSAKLVYDQLATKIDTGKRGAINGVASLDASGKVPLSQINDVLLGAVNYQGVWSPLTKTPTLPAATAGNKGCYYVANTDSSYLGILYKNKDWIVSNGSAWQKVDNNNLITTVFGRVGNVTATTYDITPAGNRGYITPTDSIQLDNLATNLSGKALKVTTITATAPITIDGITVADLSANRTIAINAATPTTAGSLSAADKVKIDNARTVQNADSLSRLQEKLHSSLDQILGRGQYHVSQSERDSIISAEQRANKSIDIVTDGASDIKYPSVKAVKTYADGRVSNSIINGVMTAPAQDTVFHALATKEVLLTFGNGVVRTVNVISADTAFVLKKTTAVAMYQPKGSYVPTALNNGQILIGNGSNVATAVTPSGDVTIANTGTVTVSNAAGDMRVAGTLKNVGIVDDAVPDSLVTIAAGVFKRTSTSVLTVTTGNITGILGVPKGGTGNSIITPGSIPQGNDINPTSERTLAQLKSDIGAADNANYSSFKIETFAETSGTPSGHVLVNYPVAATATQVAVNGSVLEPGKYSVLNKTVTLTIPTYQYDKVVVSYGYDYSGDAAYADKWYGVERDITSSSADWTRIGYMSLHASLPVQSLLKGVVLNANRTVNYYLYPSDWSKKSDGITASVLTGADGNVMVRKDAATYWKFEQIGNIQRVKCSIYPIPGFSKIDTWNVGAYEAYLSSGKLSSFKGVLPTTSRTETQYRTDARANGAGYNQLFNEPYAELLWMFVVEYATTNIQKAVAGADGNGYKTGGLGNGVTTAVSGEWAAYNSYSPFITTGSSDNLANNSGETSVTITNFGGAGVNRSFTVPRYRGIENLFGHIWKWVDGISFNHTATASEVWIYDNPDLIADNTSVGARFAGYLPSASGWTTNVLFGPRGDILPSAVGGDSSTYFADYFWTSGASTGWKALFSFATAADGVSSGLFAAHTTDGASYANTVVGARLFAK